MWSVLVFVVALVASGSGIPIGIDSPILGAITSGISPISTAGRPLVSILAVPEARARIVAEIEGLMDELDLPCKDSVRTTLFVALLKLEGQRVAREASLFKALEVRPLMAKMDPTTQERLAGAIHELYTEVLERPVVNEIMWYKGMTNTRESCRFVKSITMALRRIERTIRETPEMMTVAELKRTLMTELAELKGVRDCSELVTPRDVALIFNNIMTRLTHTGHLEKALFNLEARLHEIIVDPVMRSYVRDTLETMATKSVSFMAYMMTSLNTLIHSGTRPTEILVNWLYTLSTMTSYAKEYSHMGSMYRMEGFEPFVKHESMKYPYATPYASSYPSSYKFPSFHRSLKYPMTSAHAYSLPMSALPYPSPFPMSSPFIHSRHFPSAMSEMANKLYSAPYLFALGSHHHMRINEGIKSVMSTVEMARTISLPSPADPCFSQKITAFNAVLLTVLNSVEYSAIHTTLSILHKELAMEMPSINSFKGSRMQSLDHIILKNLAQKVLKPEMVAVERLYNIPELRPILSHHYALMSSVISSPAHISPKVIAAVLRDVAEVIRTDEALCRIDARRIVPAIEEVLATIGASFSWEAIEFKLMSGLKQCLAMTGQIEDIPEQRIYEIIAKVRPTFAVYRRQHETIVSSLIAGIREGRASTGVVAEILVALGEINKSPMKEVWGARSSPMNEVWGARSYNIPSSAWWMNRI